jgi:uncharacterized membrane protein YcaP (DUF421 family)
MDQFLANLLSATEKLLIGDEEWSFIPQIVLRTALMYLIVLFSLRLLGKRGVKQLSVFELVVIISLGSAAGDPMFYREVGLMAAVAVFSVIVISYKVTSYFVNKNKKIEELLEGSCTYLIEDGEFAIENFKKESLAQDEFFSELRLSGIVHLGQIKLAIIETSGSVSVFFLPDDEVRYGLPILPHVFCKKLKRIVEEGHYSCSFCGYTSVLAPAAQVVCKRCGKEEWVKSLRALRIT